MHKFGGKVTVKTEGFLGFISFFLKNSFPTLNTKDTKGD